MKLYKFIVRNIGGILISISVLLGILFIIFLCRYTFHYFFPNEFSLIPQISYDDLFTTVAILGVIVLIILRDYSSINRTQLSSKQKQYFFKRLFIFDGDISDIKRDYISYNFNSSNIHQIAFKEMNLKALMRVEDLRFILQAFISYITIPGVIFLLLLGVLGETFMYQMYIGVPFIFLLYAFRKHYIDRVLFPAKMVEGIRNVKDLFNSKNWEEDLNINDEVYFENYWLINTTLTPIEKLKHFENIMDVICDYDYNLIKEKCFIKVGSKYKVIPIRQGQDAPTLIALLSAFEELDFFPKFINKNKILIPDTIIHKWLKIKFEFKEYPTDSPFRSDTIIKRLDSEPNRDYKKLVIRIIKESKIK